jgi:antitoxin component YwqK of YwqJK toxin-antitoxin module
MKGLKKLYINRYNSNGEPEGYWEGYYSNGVLWFKGSFVNGIRDGYWEIFYDNGELLTKGNYVNGKLI